MTINKCVRCGKAIEVVSFTNRLCAPCCDECQEAVIKEVKKNYRDWPFGWKGGWLWDGKMWCQAKVYEGTQK